MKLGISLISVSLRNSNPILLKVLIENIFVFKKKKKIGFFSVLKYSLHPIDRALDDSPFPL